jgi:hypothetical protein
MPSRGVNSDSHLLAHQLMQLHALLPALSSHMVEAQATCEEAVRALARGTLDDEFRSGGGAAHLANVRTIIRGRKARERFMPPSWFSDPAWDMLLQLYLACLEGKPLTVGELGQLTGIKPTTVNRWLDTLVCRDWIDRHRCEEDARRVWIALSDRGADQMAEYFESLGDHDD